VQGINAASQQQPKTYIAGAPVYISASRPEEAKPQMARSISPDTSKNTTSQSHVYRGDSPTIVTHTYGRPNDAAINRIEISRTNSDSRQAPTYETLKAHEGSHRAIQ
jgi:hypothetical protein